MKRIVVTLALICACHASFADTSGDWTYTVSNNEATITGYTGVGGAVTIPSEVNGILVKKLASGSWLSVLGFQNSSVTSVSIPNSVIFIGSNAFQGCASLASITIPNSVTSIGDGAFLGCSGLTGTLTIPNSVISIGGNAFRDCSSLTTLSIPNSVTSIGGRAFERCTGLIGTLTIPNGGTIIEEEAFIGCSGLTTLTIPNSVTRIGVRAFAFCSGLIGTLTIPNGVTIIEEEAFSGCSGLTTLTIPNSVTSIGDNVFSGCSGLTTLTIPNSVIFIGSNAFRGCSSLTTLTIPDRFIAQLEVIGISGQLAFDHLANALANNDAFVTAVANKIKATGGNYGIATQSGLSSAIEPLATKTQITTAINEGKASGIASVTASPTTWSLFTSSQIQNMAIGDLVLTKEVNGNFVLNYDIEQSSDLANWTVYSANTQIVRLPADKAFVRIKAKQ